MALERRVLHRPITKGPKNKTLTGTGDAIESLPDMASYNFADVTVAGEFPYQSVGIASLAAFAASFFLKGETRRYAVIGACLAALVYLASVPRLVPDDTGGILDYNANLNP